MGAHRLAGRGRIAVVEAALVAAALVLASVVLALPARAATFAATASVDVHAQYVGDTAKDFTFTVTNTGTADNVAAVLISKPNTRWVITACPQSPAGWTATAAVTVSDTKCRYTSAAGPADDILPAGSSSAFVVRANSVPGATDATGNWVVFVSKNGSFGSADIAGATPAVAGALGTTAHVWEITDAVVGAAAVTPGTACPTSAKQAETGSATAIVVCGKSHANTALTPAAANSTLAGTFVQTTGTFASGPVAAASPSPVVLGTWSGTTITGSAGAGKTVVATTGSSLTATSPLTTLTGYTATAPNAAPVLANIEGISLVYNENGPPIPVTGTITVADADNANLASAVVTISFGYLNGSDVLALPSPPAGITPSFNAATGALTLSGSASLADYQTALRAVTYVNTSDHPFSAPRTVSFQVNDGAAASNVVSRNIAVTEENDAPVLANMESTILEFPENGAPTALTSTITVSDADSANLTGATVTIFLGYQNGQDVLALPAPPAGITPTFDAATGTLTLTGSASAGSYEAALRGVTYVHTSDTPHVGDRHVSFQVNDGAGVNNLSNAVVRIVRPIPVNDAPVLANIEAGPAPYAAGNPATVVSSTVTVTDVDSTTLAAATVVISAGHQSAEDVLAVASPPAGITPVFNSATGTLTLTGNALVADYQAALRAVTYQNTSASPNATTRTVSFTVDDGQAANNLSNTVTRDIAFTGVNSAPVLANIEGTTLAFTEGDAAKVVTSTITVTDSDSANLASATVAITANYQNGEDVLALSTPPAGITPTFNAAAGTLILNGSASPADYQAALQAVTFANGSDRPTAATRTIRFQVDDGAAANNLSNVVTRDVDVTAVNDAPVLANIEGAALSVSQGDPAKVITSTITVADADSANLASATVAITGNYQNGQDVLALPSPPAGITPAFDAGSGTLTLTGSAAFADYQAALRAVTYQNTSGTPNTATRTVSFTVDDGAAANHASNTVTRDIAIGAVNSAPVLANVEGVSLAFSEGDAAKVITSTITVADADSPNLASATVTISAGYQNGQDVLALPSPPAGITPAFNPVTGTLTLTGSASLANYETALRGVTFANGSNTPSTTTRTISFQANDGAAANNLSNVATRDITFAGVNNAPVLAGIEGAALTFTEGDAAKAITATITVADADSPNLASATVTISAGYQNGQDVLALPSPPAGITPAFNAVTGTLTLSGSASPADYQAALRGVTFANPSQSPSTAARTVSFRVDDGAAANNLSNTVSRSIAVSAVNDAPALANVEAGAITYTENNAATPITSTITVADADGTTLTGGTVSISTGFANGQDVLSFTNQLGITGSYNAGTGVLTLSGTASLTDYQTALRDVKYSNTSESPNTTSRTVSFRVNDGAAANNLSNIATRSITVLAVNDAPVLAGIEGTALSYTENDPATAVSGAITVTDPDSTNLTGATVTITTNYQNGQDVLSFANQLGITGSFNAGSGTMTLSGTSSVGNYQTALRAVRYVNTSENPSSLQRTVSFQVNDGAAANNLSNVVTRNITVTPVNDNPVATNETFTGAIGNTKLAVGVSGQASPVVEIAGNVLTNDTDVDGPGPLTATLATPNPAGGRVVTMNTNGTFVYVPPPGLKGGNDSFNYTVSDGAGGTATGTITITIQNVLVWYVDAAASPGGLGRSSDPLQSLTTLRGPSDVDAPGDIIFLMGSTTYTGGLPLENDQRLLGGPEGLVNIGTPPVTLVPANPGGTNPTITNSAGVGIPLGQNNTIRRVNVANTSSAGINGSGINTVDIGPDMTVSNSGGAGFALFGGGNGNVTFAANVTHSSPIGRAVFMGGRTGGTVNISGSVTDTGGGGVLLDTNAGATINFTGGLTIGVASEAFRAIGGGTVNVTGTNTLSSTGPVALEVTGTTIGLGGLTFQSINKNGGANGIVLNGTGSGFLTVTGTGGPVTAGSGGTIQNTTVDGISLTNVGGVVTLNGMATSTVAGTDVLVSGGGASVTYAGTINGSAGRSVNVTNKTGGTVTFGGLVNDAGGTGISLTNNTGATVNFTGAVTLSGANSKFAATGGGTVNADNAANVIGNSTPATGPALNVANTTIGASGLKFTKISSTGGGNGIILDNTGATAGLTVTGAGGTCTIATPTCSGGRIQTTTGADGSTAGVGIFLNNTKSPSLSFMRLNDHQGHAIRGANVAGFSMNNVLIDGTNGTTNSPDEGSINFTGLTGSASITNSVIQGGSEDNVKVVNTSGSLNRLTFDNVTIGANSTALGNDGMSLEGAAGTFNVTVNNSRFTSAGGDLFQLNVIGTAQSDLIFTNNTLTNNHPNIAGGGGGTTITSSASGDLTYNISNNTFRDSKGTALLVGKRFGSAPSDGTASGRIENNTIGISGTANSGSSEGSGIEVSILARGSHTTLVKNNQIYRYSNFGIHVFVGGSAESVTGLTHDGTLNVTIEGNTIAQPNAPSGGFAQNGIHLNGGTNGGDQYNVCMAIGSTADATKKNTLTGSGALGGTDYRLRSRFDTTVRLPGYTGTASGGSLDTDLTTYLTPRTSGSFTLSSSADGPPGFLNTAGGAACPLPA